MSDIRDYGPIGELVAAETLAQLRQVLSSAIARDGITRVTMICDCSERTIYRILNSENITIETAARVIGGLGFTIEIRPADRN